MNSSIVIASVFGLVCAMARAAQPATPVAVATPAVRSGSVPASCPAAVPFPDGVEAVKAIRVFKAANGESAFESVEFKGESKAYFKPGELFSHTLFANARRCKSSRGRRTSRCRFTRRRGRRYS